MYMEDARRFKIWTQKFIEKLREEKVYLGQPVIHIGRSEFTYRSRHGYNESKPFVDVYAKVKKY